MLFAMTDDGKYKVLYGESDPTVIYSKDFRRIRLDEKHPEYVLKEGDLVVYVCAEKFQYWVEMCQLRNGDLINLGTETLGESIAWLHGEAKKLYSYELVRKGVPVLDNMSFETEEEALEYAQCSGYEDAVVRKILLEDLV